MKTISKLTLLLLIFFALTSRNAQAASQASIASALAKVRAAAALFMQKNWGEVADTMLPQPTFL